MNNFVHVAESMHFAVRSVIRHSVNSHQMRHKQIHSGEQPFSCCVCNKAFGQWTNVMRHTQIHSGEQQI
jgi:KRAB domain-containing zinc finger protein